jgi:hypothetical protein
MNRLRGRPFALGNKFGWGRPKGSRNRSKMAGQALLAEYADAVTRKCIVRALEGDVRAMRLCMERISPARRDSYIRINLRSIATLQDIDAANERLVKAVSTGKIPPVDAQIMSDILDKRRGLIETVELQQRVEALERTTGTGKRGRFA